MLQQMLSWWQEVGRRNTWNKIRYFIKNAANVFFSTYYNCYTYISNCIIMIIMIMIIIIIIIIHGRNQYLNYLLDGYDVVKWLHAWWVLQVTVTQCTWLVAGRLQRTFHAASYRIVNVICDMCSRTCHKVWIYAANTFLWFYLSQCLCSRQHDRWEEIKRSMTILVRDLLVKDASCW